MPEYKHARVRGFAPWSPNHATLEIVSHVAEVLQREHAHLPLTVRQVFYRMVAWFRYPKTENSYAGLCEKINRARRAGLLSWEDIRDDGETVYGTGAHTHHFFGPRDFRNYTLRNAEEFLLQSRVVQLCHVEVHVEAAGMLPQIARICRPLGVNCYSSGGFGSVTSQYDAARRFARRDVPTVVLSIGDYDPSGVSLYWSWRENVLRFFEEGTEFIGSDWGGDGTCKLGIDIGSYEEKVAPLFRRIAVTPDQIREHGFESAPAKKTDRRGDWDGETVQCEAIPSDLLEEIVTAAVLEHYDAEAIDEVDTLAESLRPELIKRFSVPIEDLQRDAADQLANIEQDVHDRAYQEDRDWTAGYTNEDENDMEEGI